MAYLVLTPDGFKSLFFCCISRRSEEYFDQSFAEENKPFNNFISYLGLIFIHIPMQLSSFTLEVKENPINTFCLNL